MTKHTEGPWIAFYEYDNGPLRVGAGTNCTVASVYLPPAGDALANARLIAAAPDLLEALQQYGIGFADEAAARAEFGNYEVDRELMRRAAIARATGESK